MVSKPLGVGQMVGHVQYCYARLPAHILQQLVNLTPTLVIQRAQRLIPDLPTASLYRITALLERALAAPAIDPNAYDELAKALRSARPRKKRKDL